jgi:hypothetical protein
MLSPTKNWDYWPYSENRKIADTTFVKRYLLFTYYVGRPLGGAKDFLDSFDTVEEAFDNLLEEWTRYYQIVDRDSSQIIREGLARFKNFTPDGFKTPGQYSDENF